jgi:dTDP-4-dehydrorhamnose 3,5-epimerase
MGPMELRKTSLPDVLEIIPKRHQDARGYFTEIFREDWFAANVADVCFVQENQSLSRDAGVVRGLHFQTPPAAQGKLVRCVAGAIFDVAVDIRAGSRSFGQWTSVVLSAEQGNQLWIPEGFLHGFCTLVPDCVVAYKVTAYYSPDCDRGVLWNDPDLAIHWPISPKAAGLSAKDISQPRLADLPSYFSPAEV